MPRAAFAQLDERRIASQLVHGVQGERHVVEVQILDATAAKFKELFAHDVGIRDDDRIDLAGRPRRQDSTGAIGFVRQIGIHRHAAEHGPLHQILVSHCAGLVGRFDQRRDLIPGIRPNRKNARIHQHDLLQARRHRLFRVETLRTSENKFLR